MRYRNLSVVMSTVFFVLVWAITTPCQVKPKPIKIGLIYELTGIYSGIGKDPESAARIAGEWINKSGGVKGHLVEFATADAESNATKAALAAKKLIEVERVHILQGCSATGIALAVGPVCEANGTSFISACASDVFENTLKPRWSFRTSWKGWDQIDLMLGMAKKIDPKNKTIAILYQGAAMGKYAYDMSVDYAPKRDLKIVAAEKYDPAGTDFGAQISKILAANPDAVIVFCADMAGALAIKQMREMGMNKPIFVNGAIVVKAIREAFKEAFSIPPYVYVAGGKPDIWWQLPKGSDDYKVTAPIASIYEKRFGEQYDTMHGLGTAGQLLTRDAFERALNEDPNLLDRDLQTIRTAVRDKMEATTNLNIGYGVFTMTPKNHCGLIPGSNFAPFHYEKGKNVYDPKLAEIKVLPPPPVQE